MLTSQGLFSFSRESFFNQLLSRDLGKPDILHSNVEQEKWADWEYINPEADFQLFFLVFCFMHHCSTLCLECQSSKLLCSSFPHYSSLLCLIWHLDCMNGDKNLEPNCSKNRFLSDPFLLNTRNKMQNKMKK